MAAFEATVRPKSPTRTSLPSALRAVKVALAGTFGNAWPPAWVTLLDTHVNFDSARRCSNASWDRSNSWLPKVA